MGAPSGAWGEVRCTDVMGTEKTVRICDFKNNLKNGIREGNTARPEAQARWVRCMRTLPGHCVPTANFAQFRIGWFDAGASGQIRTNSILGKKKDEGELEFRLTPTGRRATGGRRAQS